jgi:hypothetical protein
MKSKRNRHTGKCNAERTRILETGRAVKDSKGSVYMQCRNTGTLVRTEVRRCRNLREELE